MFFDAAGFSFTRQLEQGWRAIADELEAIRAQPFLPWPEKFLYEGTWDVFGLYAFGRRLTGNCNLCPVTTRVVESIPGMTTAGFSVLAAGTVIRPHVGYTSEVLRCHLGLVVPPGCALRVGSETRSWQTGHCLVFDDTVEHEAWNKGAADRTVLLIDFGRPRPAAI